MSDFAFYQPGSALPSEGAEPRTPYRIPHRGGVANPSAAAIQQRVPGTGYRVEVVWGETTVYIPADKVLDVCRFLHDDPSQRYEYLCDVTAVEYRDASRPIEVVWHIRSLAHRRFLRLKVELTKGTELKVPSVWSVWRGADWLERECYDMFGIKFEGHPDLRRILMWEGYKEGFPLRKDFPLRGRFSRSEQLKQALAANPEARYSMDELTIADAYGDVPDEMRKRLAGGEKVGE
ncbi:MAG TPA: NADH-quinone oxidoreductase subunit C [Gemmatimonadaceae bacterium]|nr:NADH-quinone oxidoreductase subunit C [Gemmatimonadaceae bacterium]